MSRKQEGRHALLWSFDAGAGLTGGRGARTLVRAPRLRARLSCFGLPSGRWDRIVARHTRDAWCRAMERLWYERDGDAAGRTFL